MTFFHSNGHFIKAGYNVSATLRLSMCKTAYFSNQGTFFLTAFCFCSSLEYMRMKTGKYSIRAYCALQCYLPFFLAVRIL